MITTSGGGRGAVLTPVHMLEHALEILSKPRSVLLERSLELGLRFHVFRQAHQSPMLDPPTFTRPNPLADHSGDMQGL